MRDEMTLDDYKKECTIMLTSVPPGSGVMSDLQVLLFK
jgi:hypothetical protein